MATYTFLRLFMIFTPLFGQEPGSVMFTKGFPVAIPFTGCAVVYGTAKPSPEFEMRAVTVVYWEGGRVVHTAKTFLHPDGTYFAVITGLTSGVEYNVSVSVVETR